MKLIVLDIDNTIFDWVNYYVNSFSAMMQKLEGIIGIPYLTLAGEAKKVFASQRSIEYPFVIQNIPQVVAHYGADIDRMLKEAVEPSRLEFNRVAKEYLVPYPGVIDTIKKIKKGFPGTPIVVLTDAPRYVAMWKLNKLNMLELFDAVYGLPDPKLPTSLQHGRVMVDPEILLKHLQQDNYGYNGRIRVLPEDYEKPGTKGLRTVLIDFELDQPNDRSQVLWVGDNLRKDVTLGRSLGVVTMWAKYGTVLVPGLKERLLEFSPDGNVQKNVYLDPQSGDSPRPHHTLESFTDICGILGL